MPTHVSVPARVERKIARPARVGPRASTQIPANARQVDMAGRTIVPGYIDGHGHGPYGVDELVPQQNWSILSHLALGVTTIHDPSSTASDTTGAPPAALHRVSATASASRVRLRDPRPGSRSELS